MRRIVYIFLFLSQWSFSQTAILDTNSILIGDQIKLNISVELEENESYNWPKFTDTVFNKVEILKRGKIIEIKTETTKIFSQQLTITSFDSGSYYIPPFVFNENKKTNGLLLNVNTILITDSSGMADISLPIKGTEEDFTEEELAEMRQEKWNIFFIIIAALLLCTLVYYLIKKYKKDGVILKPKKIIAAHITALNKLQNLNKQKLWQKGELKEYYSEISTIIREYTELRFGFNALELPTSDILLKLTQIKIEKETIQNIETILKRSDNIKYAKGFSIEEENKQTMNLSVDFIKKTKIENHGVSK
jgi:rRNA-processing protein FCF1